MCLPGFLLAQCRVGLDDAEGEHCIRDFLEACDIGATYVINMIRTRFAAVFSATIMNPAHDVLEKFLQIVFFPGNTRRVLAHLQTRYRNTARVSGLARRKENARLLKEMRSFQVGRHVGALADSLTAIGE